MELKEEKLEIENDLTLLTDIVRKVYSSYLEKTLTENYVYWYCSNLGVEPAYPPIDWLKKCTLLYENEALKSCMILEYYRKKILEIISDIKNHTSSGKLADKIKLYSSENDIKQNSLQYFCANASTQTDDILLTQMQGNFIDTNRSCMGNANDIKYKYPTNQTIENQSNNSCMRSNKKLKMSDSSNSSQEHSNDSNIQSNITNVDHMVKQFDNLYSEQDEIEMELNEMFKENMEIDEFDELFGYNINAAEKQSNEILKDIEIENKEKFVNNYDNNNNLLVANNINPLKDSIWPCELHMRKQKLCGVLSQADDVFLMERIKNKFNELFGNYNVDDDFVWYSPSLELNDILLSSCMKRIAPWIVKHLMPPLNEGLISNRFLFKKLAKSLALQIIIEHQYPDERYIYSTIQEFFCRHARVDTIEDINFN